MKQRHLSPEYKESGPLPQLLQVQTALAWDLLHALQPDYTLSQAAYVAAAPLIRLDALENYTRGLMASNGADKLQRLRAAVRLDPSYTQAVLELGKTYFQARDYAAAANWLARVPNNDSLAREANFFLGLSAYYQGNFSRAQAAFRYLAEEFPLIEVFNNLGVVSARLGTPEAGQLFQKAAQADPSDADYRFNLGLSLYHDGDIAGASRQLRECLALRPGDSEAKALLASMAAPPPGAPAIKPAEARSSAVPAAVKPPMERVKRNYDEAAFRQLALEMQNASESRLAKLDPHTHGVYHVRRGRDLLEEGFPADAEKELREAVDLDSGNALAHAALAEALDLNHDPAGARAETEAALRLNPSAEVYVILARRNLRENNREGAAALVDRALQLEAGNAEALAMKQKLDKAGASSSAPKP
jgi:tetratricopeptide (TPR) repeat protein